VNGRGADVLMKRFEYKTVFYNAKEKGLFNSSVDRQRLERDLNDFGRAGWELCTTISESLMHELILVFKREIRGWLN